MTAPDTAVWPSRDAARAEVVDESEEVKIQLWRAMKENIADEITKIVSSNPEIVNADLGHANNPVKAAVYLSKPETMQLLLKLGGNPDARESTEDDSHWTALHKAVTDGNNEMVRVLLDAGADATITWNGQTTVSLATDETTRAILAEHAAKATATATVTATADDVKVEVNVVPDEAPTAAADGVVPETAAVEPIANAAAEPAAVEPAVGAAASTATIETPSDVAAEAVPDISADEPVAETAMEVEPAAAAAVAATEAPAAEEPVVVAVAAAAPAAAAPAVEEASAPAVDEVQVTASMETDTPEDGPSPKKARIDEPAAEAVVAVAAAPAAAE